MHILYELTLTIEQWRVELGDTQYLGSLMAVSTQYCILNENLDHELAHFSAQCKNINLIMFMFIKEC